MTQWADAPKVQGPPQTNDISVLLKYVRQLADVTARMAKDLEFILNGNVSFDNIHANAITTDKLQAGSVIAEKIDVDQLSAISADLGTITAGEVYGTFIATSQLGRRFEIAQNGIRSYDSGNHQRIVMATTDDASTAAIVFFDEAGNSQGELNAYQGTGLTLFSNSLIIGSNNTANPINMQGNTRFNGLATFNAGVSGLGINDIDGLALEISNLWAAIGSAGSSQSNL